MARGHWSRCGSSEPVRAKTERGAVLVVSTESPQMDTAAHISRIVHRHGGRADALIEVLHQVQDLHGHLPRPALLQVAQELHLPLSRVQGVATFYHLFRLAPPTAHRCAVCLGTACYVKGAADLARELETRLGVRLDAPEGDGTWALQAVSCLGACGQAPVLLVDGEMVPRLEVDAPSRLGHQLDQAGLPVAAGGVP